jgi:tetratricopeptide (TPR) repeat protein
MKVAIKLLILFFGALMLTNVACAESPLERLHQMVEQLQQSPNDIALREQIIRLAKTIVPALVMPDEAERRMARGTEAFKEAKSTSDYQAAVKEFQQATLAAPWSGDAYFNLGLSQDKAGNYEGSLRNLKLAQLASPESKDIKDLYYKVEYRRDKAAEQNSHTAQVAAQQAAVYQGLNGGRWRVTQNETTMDGAYFRSGDMVGQRYIEIEGHEIKEYDNMYSRVYEIWKTTFSSRVFAISSSGADLGHPMEHTITISDDGETITDVGTFQVQSNKFIRTDVFRKE